MKLDMQDKLLILAFSFVLLAGFLVMVLPEIMPFDRFRDDCKKLLFEHQVVVERQGNKHIIYFK